MGARVAAAFCSAWFDIVTIAPPAAGEPDPYAVEAALAAALAEITNAQAATITQAWAAAWSELSAELLVALTEVLADVGRVNAAAVVRFERLARVLAGVADRVDDLAGQLGASVTNDLAAVLDRAEVGTRELIAAQRLGREVPGRTVPSPALEAIVRRTTEQVTSRAMPLADETYATILGELTRGVAAGDNPRRTAARMVARAEDHWNFGRSRALNISRTETVDAYREGARVTQDAHADVLSGWVWVAHLGSRTCRACLGKHGQMFTLDEPGPNGHQQCRCARVPAVAEDDGSVDLSWLPDAEEHFAGLSPAEQKTLLGRKGYEAWLAGDFPRENWARHQDNAGWRESWVVATPDSPGGPGDGLPPLLPWGPGDGPLPSITDENVAKVLDGRIRVARDGTAVIDGGHVQGKGFPGKSEFPNGSPWDDRAVLKRMIEQTMSAAHARFLFGNRHIARREWSGVILEVGWFIKDGVPYFNNAFPVNGAGVVFNLRDHSIDPRDLDRAALTTYSWRHEQAR